VLAWRRGHETPVKGLLFLPSSLFLQNDGKLSLYKITPDKTRDKRYKTE